MRVDDVQMILNQNCHPCLLPQMAPAARWVQIRLIGSWSCATLEDETVSRLCLRL